jgi:hypothetical protein
LISARLRDRERYCEQRAVSVNGIMTRRGREAPSAKLQHPEKLQTSTSKPNALSTYWSLMFGASLELGCWTLGAF